MKKEDLDNINQFMNLEGIDQLIELGFDVDGIAGKNNEYSFSMDISDKSKDIDAVAYILFWFAGRENCYYMTGQIEDYNAHDRTTFFSLVARNWEQFETNYEKFINYLETE